MFPVTSSKLKALEERMLQLGIREADLREEFIRGSGNGGQKVNKTSSCVQLTHLPTSITVRSQRDRSQSMNRFHARRELCDRIEELKRGAVLKEQQAREKVRRQKRRRSRRAKEKMLDDKSKHKAIKRMRATVRRDDS